MAYVLSLMPHSPLAAPYQERRYERSWSSLGSHGTVRHHGNRQRSFGSLASAASINSTSWRSAEHETPTRSISYSELVTGAPLSRKRTSSTTSRLGVSAVSPSIDRGHESSPLSPRISAGKDAETPSRRDTLALDLVDEEVDADLYAGLNETLSRHTSDERITSGTALTGLAHGSAPIAADHSHGPYQRWLSTLRRRKAKHSTLESEFTAPEPENRASVSHHRKSESWTSSLDFITAVKSASVTVASFGGAALSRSGTRRSAHARLHREEREYEVRRSIDSGAPSILSVVDEAAQQRSRKRREKLEELIRSEESYVADLKALNNAFFTVLPPLQPQSIHTRTSARSNVADMIDLHNDILGELHRKIPLSNYNSTAAAEMSMPSKPTHVRWKSEDGTSVLRPRRSVGHAGWSKRRSLDIRARLTRDTAVLPCTTATVSEVAKIFAKHGKRFTLYEDYGARCELMQDDVDHFHKTISAATDYDKAIEALCASMNPTNTREANKRKALGLKDLIIKPIQRITRYELLFQDLSRYTPSCDDPSSHAILDDVRFQLKETCHNVNEAKDNPEKMRLMECSWLLQDRLCFQDKMSRSSLLQGLGRLVLCGTLFTAYRQRSQLDGRYMICILYESSLLLATADGSSQYNVMMVVPLATATIEEPDNGKGLQCHTARHAWKLLFESSGKLFEVILAACSTTEESVWRESLAKRISVATRSLADGCPPPQELASPLIKDLRSAGKAYGKSGGFVRRLSIHRTATLGPHSEPNQVIIKHTEALKEQSNNSSTSSLPIPRSQSVTTPSHVPTLAPLRQERMKLEGMLADVWSKDSLPYPGMGLRRSEYSFRDAKDDLMRKLSIASIASNFSKRSISHAVVNSVQGGSSKPAKPNKNRAEASRVKRAPLIDFHNAPGAFLPEDFELQDPRSRPGKGLNLRTFTMTGYDRPRSPFFFGQENKDPELKRSKSVKQQAKPGNVSQHDSGTGEIQDQGRNQSRQSVLVGEAKSGGKDSGTKDKFRKILGKVRNFEFEG